jgi:hypothetical protein
LAVALLVSFFRKISKRQILLISKEVSAGHPGINDSRNIISSDDITQAAGIFGIPTVKR